MKTINHKNERIGIIADDFVFGFCHDYIERHTKNEKELNKIEDDLRDRFFKASSIIASIALEYEKHD